MAVNRQDPDFLSSQVDSAAESMRQTEKAVTELQHLTGTTAAFILHGNTYDLVRIGEDADARYGVLSEFLAGQLFGRWALVLHYDLGSGLRLLPGRDEPRLK